MQFDLTNIYIFCNSHFKRIAGLCRAYDIGKYSGSGFGAADKDPENMKQDGSKRQTVDKELNQIRKAKTAARKKRSVCLAWSMAVLALPGCISGCVRQTDTSEKLRDLEFTVLDKESVPSELSQVIEEKKEEPFQLSYGDQGVLYIAEGYGGQPTSGYSVEVNSLYENGSAFCIHTSLM